MKKSEPSAPRGRPRAFDRDAALRKAMTVFWERGYEGTSVGDLAAALGIAKPSLYAAFGCKEALFREAVELYDRIGGANADEALQSAPTARTAVEDLLRANVEANTQAGQPKGCLIVLGALLGTPESRPVRDFLAGLRRKGQKAIKARLRRGIADGDLPASVDVRALAAFITAVLHGLSIQARDGATRKELLRLVDDAMRAFDAIARGSRAA